MPIIDKKLSRTLNFLGSRIRLKPETGIILGSGFGDTANLVKDKQLIPYHRIPHFPVSTVKGLQRKSDNREDWKKRRNYNAGKGALL